MATVAPIDFIAIDFETATEWMNSACAIGIAVVRSGEVAETFYSLIQPPENLYNPQNTLIHGITPEDTALAPKFPDVWYEINHLFGEYPVVAHNARFDMSVLAMCCKCWLITPPHFKYVDTMQLAKYIIPGSKGLKNCANYFEINLENHHNALDDAIVCAKVALACIKASDYSDLANFCFRSPHINICAFSDLEPSRILEIPTSKHTFPRKKIFDAVKPKDILPSTDILNENHPLYGKLIVFTGDLSIDRRTAMQMAVDVGAIVKTGVTLKTTYLVVGTQDTSVVGEDGLSSKQKKAMELNQSGKADIKIISEDAFSELVSGKSTEVSLS